MVRRCGLTDFNTNGVRTRLHIAETRWEDWGHKRNKQGKLQGTVHVLSILDHFVSKTNSLHKINSKNVFLNACVVSIKLHTFYVTTAFLINLIEVQKA